MSMHTLASIPMASIVIIGVNCEAWWRLELWSHGSEVCVCVCGLSC